MTFKNEGVDVEIEEGAWAYSKTGAGEYFSNWDEMTQVERDVLMRMDSVIQAAHAEVQRIAEGLPKHSR